MRKTLGGWGETPPPPFPKSRASYFRFAHFNTSAPYYLRAWHRLQSPRKIDQKIDLRYKVRTVVKIETVDGSSFHGANSLLGSPWGELDFLRGLLVGANTILGETTGFLRESLIFPNTLDNDMIFPSELPVSRIERSIFLVATSYQSSQLLMSTDGPLTRNIRTCSRLRVVPRFPSGIVERAKRERA